MKPVFILDHLWHEIRILGPVLFLIPLGLTLFFVALTALMFLGAVVHSFIALLLSAALEACLPLAVGILVSTLAVQDHSLELLLTLPTAYRWMVFTRLALILGWTLLIEFLASLALSVFLPWVSAKPFLPGILTWLAPSLWLAGAGMLLALLLRSRSSSGAILGCIWIFQLVFHGTFASNAWGRPWFLFATLYTPGASFWLTNRLELIGISVILFAAVWWFLHNPERRFFGEDA